MGALATRLLSVASGSDCQLGGLGVVRVMAAPQHAPQIPPKVEIQAGIPCAGSNWLVPSS